ncbi:MAG TPA: hypothetical protein DCE42_09115 [Myxococcales bacterium]|nr:hypothetical protein [Deltaproteobacteria bacterium]HAA54905.1 hypothetical protein [Myxococcales bacterium]|tara:strand:+ start:3039 stop:4406 length:1368 start_codon:yes stop_codon:yes gene_type:complete
MLVDVHSLSVVHHFDVWERIWMKSQQFFQMVMNVWRKVILWGVESGSSRIEQKQISLSNFLSSLLPLFAFPYVVFHALFGSAAVMWILIGAVVSYPIVLLLNYFKRTVLARYFFVFFSNVALYTIILVLGEGIMGHLLFFPFVMFPMLFFGLNRIGGIIFGVLFSMSLYALLLATNFATPFHFPLTPTQTALLRHMLEFSAFGMLVSGALYWSWLHDQVEAELEDAWLAKSRFLANMSHELRTPLNAILGYTEILQEESEEMTQEEVQEDLARIHKATYRLLGLISDLLDLSKLEAHQMELHIASFESKGFFKDIYSMILPMAEQNNNTFSIEVDETLQFMTADKQRLEQILLNLLSNAAKFTDNGHIQLRVHQDEERYVFEVEDDGIGVSEEGLAELFNVFKQVGAPRHGKLQGTGLGLSIAQQFSRLMGGDITVTSEEGVGTTFTVHIQKVPA